MDMWARASTRLALHFNLELVRMGTRYVGY
jgi:hypothetical protein